MKEQMRAISAEFLKNRHHPIRLITFFAFALGPLFGAVFMLIMKNSDGGLSGMFETKAAMLSFEANWPSFIALLAQTVGVGGIVILGFISSWLFGREYSEGTAKDLLALPVSRTAIINAKFMYYVAWGIALALSNLILGLIVALLLRLDGFSASMLAEGLGVYAITTLQVLLLGTPVAFAALWGRGYLVPLGIVIALLVFAQIIGALGVGIYFPWSVPGIYAGIAGPEMKLNAISHITVIAVGIAGYAATLLYWKMADQT